MFPAAGTHGVIVWFRFLTRLDNRSLDGFYWAVTLIWKWTQLGQVLLT